MSNSNIQTKKFTRYEDWEIELLKDTSLSAKQLSEKLRRTAGSISTKRYSLGIKVRNNTGYFLPEEDEIVVNNDLTIKERAELLKRTPSSVSARLFILRRGSGGDNIANKANKLKTKAPRNHEPWEEQEIKLLKSARGMPYKYLASKLHRTPQAIQRKMYILGVETSCRWKYKEEDYLLADNGENLELKAQNLNRDIEECKNRLRYLNDEIPDFKNLT